MLPAKTGRKCLDIRYTSVSSEHFISQEIKRITTSINHLSGEIFVGKNVPVELHFGKTLPLIQ